MDRYKQTIAVFDKKAQAYQDRFMDLDLYNDTYDRFLELLPSPAARVLELGCGPGNITRYLLSRNPALQITATDLGPSMVKLAQQNNPAATCRLLDAREIDQLSGPFEGIMCGFCIPYLSEADCAKLFRDAAALLVSGGIIYLSAIEADEHNQSGFETSSDGKDTCFVHYHREADLRNELEANHFEMAAIFRKQYPKKEGVISTHLILIARRKAS